MSPLSASARIYNGALSVLLVPTSMATGAYYSVIYYSTNGTAMWTETWQVPVSSNALGVASVRQSSSTGSSGTGTGTGTTANQYATLPISISQVTNLTSSLSLITSSLNALTTTVNGLSSATMSKVAFVDGETPSGITNGSNATFSLSQTPSPATSLELYRNGLAQTPGTDFTLSGNIITFVNLDLPLSGDVLQAYYRVASTTTSSTNFADAEVPSGQINGSNLSFTLAALPSPLISLKLYKNGMLMQQTNDYSISGSTITFVTAATPQAGDSVTAYYRH